MEGEKYFTHCLIVGTKREWGFSSAILVRILVLLLGPRIIVVTESLGVVDVFFTRVLSPPCLVELNGVLLVYSGNCYVISCHFGVGCGNSEYWALCLYPVVLSSLTAWGIVAKGCLWISGGVLFVTLVDECVVPGNTPDTKLWSWAPLMIHDTWVLSHSFSWQSGIIGVNLRQRGLVWQGVGPRGHPVGHGG